MQDSKHLRLAFVSILFITAPVLSSSGDEAGNTMGEGIDVISKEKLVASEADGEKAAENDEADEELTRDMVNVSVEAEAEKSLGNAKAAQAAKGKKVYPSYIINDIWTKESKAVTEGNKVYATFINVRTTKPGKPVTKRKKVRRPKLISAGERLPLKLSGNLGTNEALNSSGEKTKLSGDIETTTGGRHFNCTTGEPITLPSGFDLNDENDNDDEEKTKLDMKEENKSENVVENKVYDPVMTTRPPDHYIDDV